MSRSDRNGPGICLCLLLSLLTILTPVDAWSWGSAVHRLVNRSAITHLPPECAWFAERVDLLVQLASEADRRKCCDPDEGRRHYIDIDDYPEFLAGTLQREFETVVSQYGERRVLGNGILPWVIDENVERLAQRLEAEDWAGAARIAADIGHYAADLHSPLHLTLNYDGQFTGQRGIHSRHESRLTSRFLSELEPAAGHALALQRPLDSVFDWIDAQYAGVALILAADRSASAAAGGTSGETYYDEMWEAVGAETREWVQAASVAVASLWYTAWLRASGVPIPEETVVSAPVAGPLVLHPATPNPFTDSTQIRFELPGAGPVRITIHDTSGRRVRSIIDTWIPLAGGVLGWGGVDDDGAPLASGVYFIRLEQQDQVAVQKVVLTR